MRLVNMIWYDTCLNHHRKKQIPLKTLYTAPISDKTRLSSKYFYFLYFDYTRTGCLSEFIKGLIAY